MNELQFQTALCKEIRTKGGFAMKMSHGFLAGVPDLFVSIPAVGNGFLECKLAEIPKKKPTVRVDVTPLQVDYLRRIRSAGTVTGLAVALVDDKKKLKRVGFFTVDYLIEHNNQVELARFKEVASKRAMDDVYAWTSTFLFWRKQIDEAVAREFPHVANRQEGSTVSETNAKRSGRGASGRVAVGRKGNARVGADA